MSLLIAGFGDLGRQIAQEYFEAPGNIPGPVLALGRSVNQLALAPGIRAIKADLSDPDTLNNLPGDITHIVYCASADGSQPQAYRAIYVDGLRNLLTRVLANRQAGGSASRGSPDPLFSSAFPPDPAVVPALAPALDQSPRTRKPPRVVFVSSTAVYAKSLAGWVDESSATEPERFNGQIMLEAEALCQQMIPDAQILRLSGIYGPGRTYLLKRLMAGQATIPASTDFWANRSHIEDAARAVLHLLNLTPGGQTFIGTDCFPLPLREVYLDLAKRLSAPTPPEGPPSAMMGRKRLSNRKLLDSGFEFRWPDSRTGYQTVIESFIHATG